MPFWGWVEPEPRPYNLPQYFASSMLSSKKSWRKKKRFQLDISSAHLLFLHIQLPQNGSVTSLMWSFSLQNRKFKPIFNQLCITMVNSSQFCLPLFWKQKSTNVLTEAEKNWTIKPSSVDQIRPTNLFDVFFSPNVFSVTIDSVPFRCYLFQNELRAQKHLTVHRSRSAADQLLPHNKLNK